MFPCPSHILAAAVDQTSAEASHRTVASTVWQDMCVRAYKACSVGSSHTVLCVDVCRLKFVFLWVIGHFEGKVQSVLTSSNSVMECICYSRSQPLPFCLTAAINCAIAVTRRVGAGARLCICSHHRCHHLYVCPLDHVSQRSQSSIVCVCEQEAPAEMVPH